jgi:hypothetical protein
VSYTRKIIFAALLFCASNVYAGWSTEHDEITDYYDWLQWEGYNELRDTMYEIGEWNRRELEGHWPEVEYSYYEWDDDWYYEDEE